MRTRMSARKWSELVAAWESSGVSAEAFASEHGVMAATLKWWKTELGRRARNEGRRRPPPPKPRTGGGIAFAKVVRQEDGVVAPRAVAGVAIVVGRARIVVEHGFDRQLLRDVVRVLEEAR